LITDCQSEKENFPLGVGKKVLEKKRKRERKRKRGGEQKMDGNSAIRYKYSIGV
jgi:hypothetical protein